MTENPSRSPSLIVENDKKLHFKPFLLPIATLMIYSMIIPVLILDLWTTLYQLVYFSAAGIPKIHKKDYIIFDRWELHKLTLWQKINCVYCEYVNGLIAWAKGVSNQTEIYSCAIKHSARRKGQENEINFYKYEKFE